jgi:hypothetical protein
MLMSPLLLALLRKYRRSCRTSYRTPFGCHFWLFIKCPTLKRKYTFLTFDVAIFLSFFQIFIESIDIIFAHLALSVSRCLIIIDMCYNPNISKRVPALGGGSFAQTSLINNFRFARVTILRSCVCLLLSVICLIICNSFILRRPLSSLLNQIFSCNSFLQIKAILSHVLKGWNRAKILNFKILTESSSFILCADVLILGIFQAVKVR